MSVNYVDLICALGEFLLFSNPAGGAEWLRMKRHFLASCFHLYKSGLSVADRLESDENNQSEDVVMLG